MNKKVLFPPEARKRSPQKLCSFSSFLFPFHSLLCPPSCIPFQLGVYFQKNSTTHCNCITTSSCAEKYMGIIKSVHITPTTTATVIILLNYVTQAAAKKYSFTIMSTSRSFVMFLFPLLFGQPASNITSSSLSGGKCGWLSFSSRFTTDDFYRCTFLHRKVYHLQSSIHSAFLHLYSEQRLDIIFFCNNSPTECLGK